MCRFAGDAWVCADREGRGWESLDIDVHWIDMAEGLMRSHLKINLYGSLERVYYNFKHVCVCVCVFKSV